VEFYLNSFSTSGFSPLEHPLAAVLIGLFGTLILLGIARKFSRLMAVGVIGLTVTIGAIVWRLSG
jgi:hypothetical protein